MISRPTLGQLSESRNSIGHGGLSTTEFLFGDEDRLVRNPAQDPTSPDVNNYLKMSAEDNKFPVLVKRDTSGLVSLVESLSIGSFLTPPQLSASSAALDLAMTQNIKEEPQQQQQPNWPHFARHKPAQHSLPSIVHYPYTPPATATGKPTIAVSQAHTESPTAYRRHERGSVDLSYLSYMENNRHGMHHDGMPKLQSSFSTSDLPTMRNIANYGRISMMDRHRRESSTSDLTHLTHSTGGITFGPPIGVSTLAPMAGPIPAVITPPGISPLPSPGIYAGYPHPMFHAAPFGAYPFFAPQQVPMPQVPKQQEMPAPQMQSVPQRPPNKRSHDCEYIILSFLIQC